MPLSAGITALRLESKRQAFGCGIAAATRPAKNGMPKNFFEERTEASLVKAQIVDKYFRAWAGIVAPRARGDRIAYIDLFAGPGRYRDGSSSVPLMVLQHAINDPQLRKKLVTVFNDKDENNTRTLEAEIKKLKGVERLKFEPEVLNNEVGSAIAEHFEKIGLIPTLFFVDPWGYKGLSLNLSMPFKRIGAAIASCFSITTESIWGSPTQSLKNIWTHCLVKIGLRNCVRK